MELPQKSGTTHPKRDATHKKSEFKLISWLKTGKFMIYQPFILMNKFEILFKKYKIHESRKYKIHQKNQES